MDPGFATPLLDMFRRGEVERDLRLAAARSAVAPRAHEQIALLALLADDPDAEVKRAAAETLDLVPREALAALLARSDTPPELRQFFARRGVEPAEVPAPNADQPLIDIGSPPVASPAPDRRGVAQRLATLSVMERMKVAMKGDREARAILIRDSSKLVAAAVLSSPKLTETEVEAMAKMSNVASEVLRIIGSTRAWVKNYGVASALVRNPKTPIAIALPLVPRLNERDVKLLALDRNVPEPIRLAARKFVATAASRKR